MLPTRLNVLPPDKQKHLQRMIRNEFFRSMLATLVVACALIGMALLAGRMILQIYFADLADTITAVTVDTKEQNKQVEQANARIMTANRVLATTMYWPEYIVSFTDVVPDTVRVSTLSFDGPARETTVSGVAETRDALLGFADALRTLAWVEKVDIPISQLTQQTNISFTLRILSRW